MELGALKQLLQEHFADGLVTIVGSGLSAAAGLPTMPALAAHLADTMPKICSGPVLSGWDAVATEIAAAGDLEKGLSKLPEASPLIPLIVHTTAELILAKEMEAIRGVSNGSIALPFVRLVPHITFADQAAHVITSNYDRLIEFGAEMAGVALDTGFIGYNYGAADPKLAIDSISTFTTITKHPPGLRRRPRRHVALHKPHGSVDWFVHDGRPVRSTIALEAGRLMITPGTSKYRMGYDPPFDYQRTAANKAIDNAARFLVIGYGFNDDQLETHLRAKLAEGRPCVILARGLTSNAQKLIANHPSVLALSHASEAGVTGTRCDHKAVATFYPNIALWDLSEFIREVLE